MRKAALIATCMALGTGGAYGADLAPLPDFGTAFAPEAHGGLHAGGLAAIYLGYLAYDPDNVDINDAEQGIVGTRLAYAHPLGPNFSAQFDFLGEVNITSDSGDDNDLTRGDYMAALHLSARDPSRYLVGLFGGGGQSFDNGDNSGGDAWDDPIPFWFAGLEGQVYLNNVTLGGQVGYLDSDDNWFEAISDAWFVRAIASFYWTENTKLSAEFSYLHGDRPNCCNPNSGGIIDIYGWGARIDHQPSGWPISFNLAYNGYDYQPTEESDRPWVHEVRGGVTFYFGSGSLMDNDRRAAGADLPPINRWVSTSANEIE